jgi:mycofactocin precursor
MAVPFGPDGPHDESDSSVSAVGADVATVQREPTPPAGRDGAPVLEELLVEDVSIDGMCGVY